MSIYSCSFRGGITVCSKTNNSQAKGLQLNNAELQHGEKADPLFCHLSGFQRGLGRGVWAKKIQGSQTDKSRAP